MNFDNDRWNSFVKDQEEPYKVVCSDFDDTLRSLEDGVPNETLINKIKDHINDGASFYVVSSRRDTPENKAFIQEFLNSYELPVCNIFLTDLKAKVLWLIDLDAELFFDNEMDEIDAVKQMAPQIEAVLVDTFLSPEYIDEIEKYQQSVLSKHGKVKRDLLGANVPMKDFGYSKRPSYKPGKSAPPNSSGG